MSNRVTRMQGDAARFERYNNSCYRAALHQGLAPIALRLAAANIPFTVDQTGGFCMTVGVYLTPDPDHYVWVTNVNEGVAPESTVDDQLWYVCRYFPEEQIQQDTLQPWTALAESGTTQAAARLIATELEKAGTAGVAPDVEGTEELFRDACTQGLAPMALRLTVERIDFTVQQPDNLATVLQIPSHRRACCG
jgi:hypothetical protein